MSGYSFSLYIVQELTVYLQFFSIEFFTIFVYNTIQYVYSAVKFTTGKFVEDKKKLILTFNPRTRPMS